jgi:hypothetical protein
MAADLIRRWIVVGLLAVSLAGCDVWNRYPYSGVVRTTDGHAPRTPVKVAVLIGAITRSGSNVDQLLTEIATPSDSDGNYRGVFFGHMTSPLFPPPAPPLKSVCVYINGGKGWTFQTIQLDETMQKHTGMAERSIELPPVIVADESATK